MEYKMIYTLNEMMDILKVTSPYGIYRAAEKYRETQGKYGIPNVQLNGPGSRVIFPKPMIDRWLIYGNEALLTNPKQSDTARMLT